MSLGTLRLERQDKGDLFSKLREGRFPAITRHLSSSWLFGNTESSWPVSGKKDAMPRIVGVALACESQGQERLHARKKEVVFGDPRVEETMWVNSTCFGQSANQCGKPAGGLPKYSGALTALSYSRRNKLPLCPASSPSPTHASHLPSLPLHALHLPKIGILCFAPSHLLPKPPLKPRTPHTHL